MFSLERLWLEAKFQFPRNGVNASELEVGRGGMMNGEYELLDLEKPAYQMLAFYQV